MAERRMISKKIIHSDAFLDLPATTQNLYFHLLLEADDEGFVNSPKRIQRTVGASDIDAQLLLTQKFIIGFESGVVVIKHWRIHNYIQNDRFKPTTYIDERSKLSIEENNGYRLDTNCTPSIEEIRLDKSSIEENREEYRDTPKKEFSFSLSRDTHYSNLSEEYKTKLMAKCLLIDGDFKRYEDFVLSLQSKSSYKYKDFTLVYKAWDKEKKYKSFKPLSEPNLGERWVRVCLGMDKVVAINLDTLEMKQGTIKNIQEVEEVVVETIKTHERDLSSICGVKRF